MSIPNRKDIYGQPAEPYQQESLKTKLEKATSTAINKLSDVLNNTDASQAEIISAATKLITMAHGKDGLRIEEEKTDSAKLVAEAIKQSRDGGLSYDKILVKFLAHHELDTENAENAITVQYLHGFIQAIKYPTEYFSDSTLDEAGTSES